MQSKLLHDLGGQKTFALAFSTGDQLIDCILSFAQTQGIRAAQVTGIGGLSEITLGYFDWTTKDYKPIPLHEQLELVSLNGNISMYEDKPRLHAHVVVGKSDGSAWAGHLLGAVVRPTAELFLVQCPAELRRTKDDESGLPLWNLKN